MNDSHELSVFNFYEKNALHKANSCAIHHNNKNITHAQLFSQTARFANGLKKLNLAPGARIAILCKNHPVFFHLFGAACALNLVLVLINRRLTCDEVSYIIEDTRPNLLICDGEMAQMGQELCDSFSFLKRCYVVDQKGPNDLSNLYDDTPLKNPVPFKKNDPFIIIHTAAVQGKPRGAVLSQENIILSNLQIIPAFGLDNTKTYLNILPLFHIMGINLGLGTLQAGGNNVIIEKFDPPAVLELIENQSINMIGSFPPMITLLIEAAKTSTHNLSSLETTAGIDTADTMKEWETLTHSKFWTMYGQTETSGLISFAQYSQKPGSAGTISSLAHIKIADNADRLLPSGQTGEIVVRGPLVFSGYWNADKLNEHTFRQGWHHTGDLGMIDDEGFLFFKGRKPEKELIKPGGENVFPAEVEHAICEHDAIKEACVFGVPDPKFGEGVKAVCSLNPGYELSKKDLISFCGSRIAGYKKPRYVEFITTLPKTESGTIDREKIKTEYA